MLVGIYYLEERSSVSLVFYLLRPMVMVCLTHRIRGIIMAKKYQRDVICDIGLIKSASTISVYYFPAYVRIM